MVSAEQLVNFSPTASGGEIVAIRTQRDVSMNVPIDQTLSLGLSLSQAIFSEQGYTDSALQSVQTVLNLGVETLMLDLYWNEYISKWQLCPAPIPANATQQLDYIATVQWQGETYKCQLNATIDSLMNNIINYFKMTNTNMDVSMVQLLVNLKDIRKIKTNSTSSVDIYTGANPLYLSSLLSYLYEAFSSISSFAFTPVDLQAAQLITPDGSFYNQSNEIYPTLSQYLLSEYNRVSIFTSSNQLAGSTSNSAATVSANQYSYNISVSDEAVMFLDPGIIEFRSIDNSTLASLCQELTTPDATSAPYSVLNYSQISLTQHFRFIADDSGNPFDNSTLRKYIRCGYTPILNASTSTYVSSMEADYYNFTSSTRQSPINYTWSVINNFTPEMYWTWAPGQPYTPNDPTGSTNVTQTPDDDNFTTTQVAYSCGLLDYTGISVGNCYVEYPYACQNNINPNIWHIDYTEKANYFNSYLSNSCPPGFGFSIPKLSIEMLSLLAYINSTMPSTVQQNERFIWVDLNDITVSQCFVTGGPYASCPYQETTTYQGLVRMIAPNFTVAVVVLLLIFCERFIRTNPIQLNRKRYWKKALGEFEGEYAYEGVPS